MIILFTFRELLLRIEFGLCLRFRELWPLDGMKLETLKERRANKKPEDLEIDYGKSATNLRKPCAHLAFDPSKLCAHLICAEDFIKSQVVEVPYIDPRAYDSDTMDEEEEQEDGEGTDEDEEDKIEVEVGEEEESERASVGGGWGRIIFPPFRKGKQVTLDMCVPTKEDGSEGAFERRVITKSKNPDLHLQAKKSFWGDLWPLTTQQERGKEKLADAEWCRPDQDQKWGAWP